MTTAVHARFDLIRRTYALRQEIAALADAISQETGRFIARRFERLTTEDLHRRKAARENELQRVLRKLT